MRDRSLTLPEALFVAVVTVLALVITVAYLWMRIARLSPFAVLGFTIATGVVFAIRASRQARRDTAALVAAIAVFGLVFGWLLKVAWPSLLPPGGGPDLAHHLVLIDFLERHWQLPDATLVPAMGEMAHYTPGVHLVAALLGAWTRTDGFHTIYAVVALTVALKAGLVFLIALRVVGVEPRVPLALTAVLLMLLPQEYFVGSFVHDSFFAQAAAEMFAVAMWWSLVMWDGRPELTPLALFASAGIGAFLTWPLWIGPPIVALAAAALTHEELPPRERVRAITFAVAPIAGIALVHTIGRVGWLAIAGSPGAVLHPAVITFGMPFLLLGGAGFLLALRQRQARTTLLVTLAIVAQAATLYALARARGVTSPYLPLKMIYLLIYPGAVLGTIPVASLWRLVLAKLPRGISIPRYTHGLAVSALLLTIVLAYRKPLFLVPRRAPVVSEDLYDAGRWARANVESACVDYLVPNGDTAYWLHYAVLGNPRSSVRSANPDTFVPARAIARWIEPGGLPYAVVDLTTLPNEILLDVDVLEAFGAAAVVKRRGLWDCPDAERLAGRVSPP